MSFRADQEAAEEAVLPRWQPAGEEVTPSLNGTHALHRFLGRWRGEVGEWVELRETATGAILLDMARVRTAKVAWRADGSLLVRIDGGNDSRLLIVDPDLRTFRDIGVDDAPRPVAELQSAVATAAGELGADGGPRHPRDAYLERDFSPDGEVMVEYSIEPQRMSHETRVPRLVDTATGETLLNMPDGLHDGFVHWREGSTAILQLRHYMGGHATMTLDYARRTGTMSDEPHRKFRLEDAHSAIARAIGVSRKPPAASPIPEPSQAGRAVLGLLLALGIFGAILLASWTFTKSPRQELTPIPNMSSRS